MKTAKQQFLRITEGRAYNFASGYNTEFLKSMGGFDEQYTLWEDGPFLNKMTRNGFAVDFEYDIVYIKYRTGGISINKNRLLVRDEQIYNSSDRLTGALLEKRENCLVLSTTYYILK